jgi:hypothetical protein
MACLILSFYCPCLAFSTLSPPGLFMCWISTDSQLVRCLQLQRSYRWGSQGLWNPRDLKFSLRKIPTSVFTCGPDTGIPENDQGPLLLLSPVALPPHSLCLRRRGGHTCKARLVLSFEPLARGIHYPMLTLTFWTSPPQAAPCLE